MLVYKNYKAIRVDENNIELYKTENRAVYKGIPGQRGKPMPTGEFADQDSFIGFYGTPHGVISKILDMEGINDTTKDLKAVLDSIKALEAWIKTIPLAIKIEMTGPGEEPVIEEGELVASIPAKRGRGRPTKVK